MIGSIKRAVSDKQARVLYKATISWREILRVIEGLECPA